MAGDPANIADLTLDRMRRLDEKIGRLAQLGVQNKIDGLIDLATATRADFSGFMKLYAAQEDAVSQIAKDVEHIKKRLDLVEA